MVHTWSGVLNEKDHPYVASMCGTELVQPQQPHHICTIPIHVQQVYFQTIMSTILIIQTLGLLVGTQSAINGIQRVQDQILATNLQICSCSKLCKDKLFFQNNNVVTLSLPHLPPAPPSSPVLLTLPPYPPSFKHHLSSQTPSEALYQIESILPLQYCCKVARQNVMWLPPNITTVIWY